MLSQLPLPTLFEEDPQRLSEAWAIIDPDPETRAEVVALRAGDGEELAKVFGRRPAFGTAGFRARLGIGPGGMNRVVVRSVAAAVATVVREDAGSELPLVIVGFDARHKNSQFAADATRVFAAAGISCLALAGPVPTPIVSFAVRHHGAAAGIMITASHNSRQDNEILVFGRGGAQIGPPVDARIEAALATLPLVSTTDLASPSDELILADDGTTLNFYLTAVASVVAADGPTEGRLLLDLLDEIHSRRGVHISGQRSVRFEPAAPNAVQHVEGAVDRLRQSHPSSIAGELINSVIDRHPAFEGLEPSDILIFELDRAWVVVRPSGTEPKLKVYGEVWEEPGRPLSEVAGRLRRRLDALITDMVSQVAAGVDADVKSGGVAATFERRAQDLFASPSTGALRLADLRLAVRCIDLTTLEGDDTPTRIRAMCATARRPDPADSTIGPVAGVCVYPTLVGLVSTLVKGTPVAAVSVAGAFPSAQAMLPVRLADLAQAVRAGASEVDVVLNRAAFLVGDEAGVRAELQQFRSSAVDAILKVIIETSELESPERIRRATELVIESGADFVKTSTGKSRGGATPAAVLAMAEAVADHHRRTGQFVGIKVSGGVRSADDVLGYIAIVRATLGEAWLTPATLRFGASSLLGDVVVAIAAGEAEPTQ